MREGPALHIVFIAEKGGSAKELFSGKKALHWTAPSTAQRGDIALFYVGGISARGIHAVGVTTADAQEEEKAPGWGAKRSGSGYFAPYNKVQLLNAPLSLDAIRLGLPRWKRWQVLLGVRVHTVPEEYRAPLSKWIAAENTAVREMLAPWLRGGGSAPSIDNDELGELRYEGTMLTRTQVTYERKNRSIVLAAAKPPVRCEVCGFDFGKAFGPFAKGHIEVHHKKLVSAGARKPKFSDFALLCSNCHSMAHWRSGPTPRSVKTLKEFWKGNGAKLRR